MIKNCLKMKELGIELDELDHNEPNATKIFFEDYEGNYTAAKFPG